MAETRKLVIYLGSVDTNILLPITCIRSGKVSVYVLKGVGCWSVGKLRTRTRSLPLSPRVKVFFGSAGIRTRVIRSLDSDYLIFDTHSTNTCSCTTRWQSSNTNIWLNWCGWSMVYSSSKKSSFDYNVWNVSILLYSIFFCTKCTAL